MTINKTETIILTTDRQIVLSTNIIQYKNNSNLGTRTWKSGSSLIHRCFILPKAYRKPQPPTNFCFTLWHTVIERWSIQIGRQQIFLTGSSSPKKVKKAKSPSIHTFVDKALHLMISSTPLHTPFYHMHLLLLKIQQLAVCLSFLIFYTEIIKNNRIAIYNKHHSS